MTQFLRRLSALKRERDVPTTAPVVREIIADAGGGGGGPVAWADVTGKPSTFPWTNRERAEIRRRLLALEAGGGGGGGPVAWADVTGKPSTFAPSAHTHPTSEVTGLDTALSGKQPLATVLTNTTAAFTTAQETKLAGIAAGATVNASDASLRDRATHTGTQAASTISDLATTVQAYTLDAFADPVAAVNFNGQQALAFRLENRTSDPGSPATGQMWLRTDL